MNQQIVFKGMSHTPQMEQYVAQKLEKIITFLHEEGEDSNSLQIVLESAPHNKHQAKLSVKTPTYNLKTNFAGTVFNKVVDEVTDAMYRNLHEAKRRLVDEKKTGGRPPRPS